MIRFCNVGSSVGKVDLRAVGSGDCPGMLSGDDRLVPSAVKTPKRVFLRIKEDFKEKSSFSLCLGVECIFLPLFGDVPWFPPCAIAPLWGRVTPPHT